MLPLLVLAPPAPKAELTLTAKPFVKPGEKPEITATIRNAGRVELRLLMPQDGSGDGMSNPLLTWTVTDAAGHPIRREPYGRCGNMNAIAPSAFFSLRPGERKELPLGWAMHALPKLQPGTNRISLLYRIDPRKTERFGGMTPEVAALYARLTPIEVTSAPLAVRVAVVP